VTWTLLQGDALEQLKTLPGESIHCCVTSPPYWGLRDYGVDGQLGLESTPDEYVAKMVEVFREVRRVLRDDGTLWLNLGDSYASGGMSNPSSKSTLGGGKDLGAADYSITRKVPNGLKPKDLVGIPWRVAFALQADGWWLRSDIIWAKPNPMPESVTDRPTKAHEYIFLLTKSERYYYDADAIKENSVDPQGSAARYKYAFSGRDGLIMPDGKPQQIAPKGIREFSSKRNKRTVWNINTKPFSEAHFAVFPPEIPEICIKAGTSEKGCCPECGASWERIIEKETCFEGGSGKAGRTAEEVNTLGKWAGKQYGKNIKLGPVIITSTTGWKPACTCGTDRTIPCTVLDPFAGAGTTLWVAEQLGVNSIGIELNPDYCEIIRQRMATIEPSLFNLGQG
jgi:DNA modification methylase